ncbi:MAG: acyltransferase [Phycisphaerales bacterium]|nr:acyltransferase [Phycisphaerales bacterium]
MSFVTGIARQLYRTYSVSIRAWDTCIGRTKLKVFGRARVGDDVRISGQICVKVSPGGKLLIGNKVRFVSGFRFNPVGHDSKNALFVGPEGTLDIHESAGLSSTTIVARKSVVIGEGTFIGGGARIYDNDFHSLDPAIRVHGKDDQVGIRPVTIGRECFIGGYAIILKGVTIGDRSIVGAGSVVSRSIPPDQIWAGNPAVFVRDLFPDKASAS